MPTTPMPSTLAPTAARVLRRRAFRSADCTGAAVSDQLQVRIAFARAYAVNALAFVPVSMRQCICICACVGACVRSPSQLQDEVCVEASVGSYLYVAATDTFVWYGPNSLARPPARPSSE
jgi:hypothetical protein